LQAERKCVRAEVKAVSLVIGLLIFLAGCTMAPRLANVSGAEGNKPEHYEPTIREHLRVTLLDPHSVQDFRVSHLERTWCLIPPGGGTFYGWRAKVEYRAKNAYGAYTGLQQSFYWFHGERIALITRDPDRCPEAW
jgi:hypothetical protein